jgi:peptidoglycan hydrolase-like protein with peptidoglycan-binding domain
VARQPPSLSRADISHVQLLLNELGYPTGPPDGRIGPKTREAIKSFQRDFNLPATGRPDAALLSALRVAAEATAKTETAAPAPLNPGPSGEFAGLEGFDLPYGDYRSGIQDPGLAGISASECEAQCASDDRCRAFTFNSGRRVCILKHTVPQPAPFAGAISGIKLAVGRPAAASPRAKEEYGAAGYADAKVVDLTAWLRAQDRGALQVTASSTTYGANNSLVVDGSTEGDYHVWNHTRNGPDEWLQVDLGAEYRLSRVEIFNRNNKKFAPRLNGAVAELRNATGNVVAEFEPISSAHEGSKHSFETQQDARYVRIRHSNQYLHVTEVKVYGFQAATANGPAASALPDAGSAASQPVTQAASPAIGSRPSVRTTTATYAPWEPIEVVFEGAPGNHLDWVTIVQKTSEGGYGPPDTARRMTFGPPDGEVKPWGPLDGKIAGSQILDGLGEGEYEVRLYARPANRDIGKIIARHSFSVVSNAGREAAGLLREHKRPSLETEQKIPAPDPGLAGLWLANNTCEVSRGITRTMTYHALLEISGTKNVSAELILLWSERIAIRMTGTFDQGTGKLTLEPSEWIIHPNRAIEPPRLSLALDKSELRLTGELLDAEGCSTFEAYKFKRDSRPVDARVPIAAYDKYKQAAVNEANCIRLAKWVIDGSTVEMNKEEVPLQVLDGEAFYHFAGKTYDDWTYDDAVSYGQFWQSCMGFLPTSKNVMALSLRDKALRARSSVENFLRFGRLTDRAGGGHVQSSVFEYSAKYALIISMRIARQYADRALAEAKSLTGTAENQKHISRLMTHIDGQFGPFAGLPPEQAKRYVAALQEQQRRLVAEQAKAALVEAEAEIRRLRDLAPASEQLSGLTALYQGQSRFHERLDPADRLALRSRVMDEQRTAAEKAVGAKLAALAALPADEGALAKIDATEDELQPIFSLLIARLAEEYRATIEKKRQETFASLVRKRIEVLSTYTADKAGLEASAHWPAEFTKAFSGFHDSREYKDAMRQFSRSRNQLLLEALPEFEKALETAIEQRGAAAIDEVQASFLTWEGDDRLPAFLEYQFAADSHR